MANSYDRGFNAVPILRGDALGDARRSITPVSGVLARGDRPYTQAQPLCKVEPDPAQETIFGVPVSAVQACCGRGCKHCRIYWHRMKS